MGRHVVCTVAELPPGSRKLITLESRPIGVFNVNGTYYAMRNTCPHQGAPLCVGTVTGMTLPSAPGEYVYGREGEIVRCPWHGWEFDVTTGKSIYDPHRCLVKTYEVTVEHEGAGGIADQTELEAEVETYPVKVEADWVIIYM